MRNIKKISLSIVSAFFVNLVLRAQIPTHLEVDTDPVNFYEWPNLLVYIVLPVLLVVFFIWWRRNKIRQRNKLKSDLDKDVK